MVVFEKFLGRFIPVVLKGNLNGNERVKTIVKTYFAVNFLIRGDIDMLHIQFEYCKCKCKSVCVQYWMRL